MDSVMPIRTLDFVNVHDVEYVNVLDVDEGLLASQRPAIAFRSLSLAGHCGIRGQFLVGLGQATVDAGVKGIGTE